MIETNYHLEKEPIPYEMKAEDVSTLLDDLEKLGIEVWLDGGWGVDALLQEQTRAHEDLDITVQSADIPRLREYFAAKGYKDVVRDDTSEHNFVVGDDAGHKVDVHVFTFDDKRNGIYGPVENGEMYPADSLTGTGSVNSHPVKCISAEWMVRFHTGYDLDEGDFRDVSALHKRFGIDMPADYERFLKTDESN